MNQTNVCDNRYTLDLGLKSSVVLQEKLVFVLFAASMQE